MRSHPDFILELAFVLEKGGEIIGNIMYTKAWLEDENGKIDASKLQPITFDPMNHHYLVLGEKVGQVFHDGLALK